MYDYNVQLDHAIYTENKSNGKIRMFLLSLSYNAVIT